MLIQIIDPFSERPQTLSNVPELDALRMSGWCEVLNRGRDQRSHMVGNISRRVKRCDQLFGTVVHRGENKLSKDEENEALRQGFSQAH